MKRPPLPILLAALFAVTVVGFASWRITYGVDFSDEAFYAAMPYTFALGNQPFVHELALQQTAAILLIPFTKVYVALRGAEGIMLAFRVLFLLLAALTGAAIFRLARELTGTAAAIVMSVLPFAIVPGILSVSYNTLGMNFLCAGACLTAHGVLRANRRSLWLAGPALILAAFAYPTLVIPGTLSAFVAAIWLARQGRKEEWRSLVYGWLGAVVLAFVVTAALGWDNLATSLIYMLRHARHGGSDQGQLQTLWIALRTSAPYETWKLYALAAAGLATLFVRKWRWLGLTLMIALLASFLDDLNWRIVATVTIYSVLYLTIVVAVTSWKRGGAPVAVMVLLPGLAAAFITAWTSSNGFPNAMIGAYTALTAALILALASAERLGTTLLPLAVAAFIAAAASSTFRHVYVDSELEYLTARIPTGPYAGLRTTPQRRDFVLQLAADVKRHAQGKRAIFYDSFPAGYLFVDTPPRVEGTWIPFAIAFPGFDRTWYTSYFSLPENRPSVVFEMMGLPKRDGIVSLTKSSPSDPMHYNFWRSGYTLAEENRYYAIYKQCAPCVTDRLEAENLLGPDEAVNWKLIPGKYSAGALAGTSRRGSVLQGTIPRFRPGPYRFDFVHYRNMPRTHELRIAAGGDERHVTVKEHAPYGLSRVTGVIFPDVRSPEFSIESEGSGKGALLLDQIAFTRAPSAEMLAARCEYCEIGRVGQRPVTFEPENVVMLDHGNLDERQRVSTEWIRIVRPSYSGGGAVMTAATGATLHGRVTGVRPGNYRVSVLVMHPTPEYSGALRITLGGVTREVRTRPAAIRGWHEAGATFPGVGGDQLSITSVNPGTPSLMIDAVTVQALDSGNP